MSKRVLFFAPYGSFQVHHQLDLMVGTALRLRGCEVKALLCDGFYPSCDVLGWSGENAARDCAACQMRSESLFAALEFPRQHLKSLVNDDDRAQAAALVDQIAPEEYADAIADSLDLGKWVTSSIFSYFRIGFDSLHLPHVRKLHRQFLINGILTWKALDRIVQEFSPSHLFVFNGRFAPYRIALEYGKRHGIPVVTHERGYIDDSFFLFENHSAIESKPFFECIKQWKSIPLSTDAISLVKKNFLDREHGKGSNYTPFINYTTDVEAVRTQLGIPQSAKVVSVFTSSEYELAYCDDFKTEISQIESLKRLCEIFRGRDEYLVIRHHPYIGGSPSSPPDVRLLAQINALAPTLPPNVRVILPSEKLSTYALFWVSSASISFLSTAGIEAIARGVPTASLPQSYYRDAMTEIMTDVSVGGLRDTIERLLARNGMVAAENLSRAYRTYYAIVGRLSQKFKSFGIRDIFEPDIRITTLEEMLPGIDSTLDRVCNHVTDGTSLIPLPTEEDKTLFAEEESNYISGELLALRKQKDEVQLKCRAAVSPAPRKVLYINLQNTPNQSTPAWTSKSRHQSFLTHSIPYSGTFHSALDAIGQLTKVSTESYVYVSNDRVTIGEAGISALVAALENPEHLHFKAARLSGWIIDSSETPVAGVFSERDPVNSMESLTGAKSILRNSQIAISFYMFRREALCELIENWKIVQDDEGITRQLLDLLGVNMVISLPLQAVLVPEH